MKYNYAAIKRMKDKDLRDEALTRLLDKKWHKDKPAKQIQSLQDDWHTFQKDYDYWTEYGFFEVGNMTDDEIQEHVDAMRVTIHSPYDCTGKPFTVWIRWKRNPCGWISVIHHKGLDV